MASRCQQRCENLLFVKFTRYHDRHHHYHNRNTHKLSLSLYFSSSTVIITTRAQHSSRIIFVLSTNFYVLKPFSIDTCKFYTHKFDLIILFGYIRHLSVTTTTFLKTNFFVVIRKILKDRYIYFWEEWNIEVWDYDIWGVRVQSTYASCHLTDIWRKNELLA